MQYRSRSFWLDALDDDLTPRAALPGDADFDVAIVGAGYTGLWTAYYLARSDPSLRIAVLEKEIAGFGASGRNGGWCSPFFAGIDKVAKTRGPAAAIELSRAMVDTIDEVGRVCNEEGIEADFHKGGTLTFATAPAHVPRIKSEVSEHGQQGFTQDDYRWLDQAEALARIRVEGGLGAAFSPHCASLQPARLARGLAHAVERRGVSIFEQTTVERIEPHCVQTSHGRVAADVVVRATEGYTAQLPGYRRSLIPLYSLMVVTEPLPSSFWEEVNWGRRETFTDGRHLLIYAQRTADDRIAMGGRGAPYHFGSRIRDSFDRKPSVFDELRHTMRSLWPGFADAKTTHEWGGPLGVPRDWFSSVGYDRAAGLAWAGGYVGDGVSTANLAGRTLRDLICGRTSPLTSLAWVGHHSRPWEPEPLRWIGGNVALLAMRSADRAEARTGRPSRRAEVVGNLIGL